MKETIHIIARKLTDKEHLESLESQVIQLKKKIAEDNQVKVGQIYVHSASDKEYLVNSFRMSSDTPILYHLVEISTGLNYTYPQHSIDGIFAEFRHFFTKVKG